MEPFLRVSGVSKQFPGVKALDEVSMEFYQGKVTALVGENGAGKSTLMKILSGVYTRDEGEIFVQGKPAKITDPVSAKRYGISTIYQELNILPDLNVVENIFIGRERRKGMVLDFASMRAHATELIDRVGLRVRTSVLASRLSTAQKQMLEVARALSVESKIIIMDEPTSSLTESETEILLNIVRSLAEQDIGVVFVSHKMKEVFGIADNIFVMRDGRLVGSYQKGEVDEKTVVNLMVGRDIKDLFAKEEAEIGETVFEVRELSTRGFLSDISFSLKKGEILGFAGLVGAGRTEVMRAVFGIDRRDSGDIYLNGEQIEISSPKDAIAHGIGLVPEDRKEQALLLNMSVRENITLPSIRRFSQLGVIKTAHERKTALGYLEKMSIKARGVEQKVVSLSGGNQQKVVISKWLEIRPRVIILDEPTRGIDVGAKKEIHLLMSKLAQEGVGIIMISSELPEILGMSDRVVVMHEGRIKGVLSRAEASQSKIMETALSTS
ncbi:MAG: sugar ABC transporter ATP-binding protein [Balneolaceae bacterium]